MDYGIQVKASSLWYTHLIHFFIFFYFITYYNTQILHHMNLTKFFRRVFQFTVVLLTFYILPALVALMISLDIDVYVGAVTHPGYAFCIGTLALVGTGFVIDEINKAENEQAIMKRF